MQNTLSETVVKKLVLAKYLYALAEENIRPEDPMTAFAGINLLQDSVEAHLLALAEAKSANIEPNTKFERYFELIDEKLSAGATLPARTRLFSLNKVRVNSKHYAIQPDVTEAIGYLTTVRDFFEETTYRALDTAWSSISLVSLIHDGETKSCLLAAQSSYEAGRLGECLIDCRKALFLEFERGFNLYGAVPNAEGNSTLWALACRAPSFARTESYVAKNVKDPTDYVVYDYDLLHRDIDEAGIRVHDYWNVWRLTPEVFRRSDGSWVVKREFAKLDGAIQNAEYVLHATVRMILAKQRARKNIRNAAVAPHRIVLKNENTPVYSKADVSSDILWITPKGVHRLGSRFLVDGMDRATRYYQVSHIPPEGRSGYILENDVERLEEGTLAAEEIDLIWGER